MSKLRADSKWNELTEEQRDVLEAWLFEENISYREALDRLQKEFGITAALSSLARFYQQLAKERMEAELLQVSRTARELNRKAPNLKQLNATAITLVNKRMIQLAVESPKNVKEMAMLARILIENEAVEIKKSWAELAREKYEDELDEKWEKLRSVLDAKENFRRMLARLDSTPQSGAAQAGSPVAQTTPADPV